MQNAHEWEIWKCQTYTVGHTIQIFKNSAVLSFV